MAVVNEKRMTEASRLNDQIACSICGYVYSPSQHPSCNGCPLHHNCSMYCCPNCGTSNINPSQSILVGWVKKIVTGGARVSS